MKHSGDIESRDIINTLSDREMSVFLAICQGKTNKEIADDMLLSEKTTSTYKTRLMQKLQVDNLIDLLELAKRHMIF
ncbi:response regulator transcription factor [Aeromonas hydrophila]|uniref:response regulator transcription factor n=1 Tax=Aeromonas hydrophila TaxID=644 RepID=UPI003985F926